MKSNEIKRKGYINGLHQAKRLIAEMIESQESGSDTADALARAMRPIIEGEKVKSAWSRGVKEYALEILDSLEEGFEGRKVSSYEDLKKYCLNGARDWNQYSSSGNTLVYDGDIAERLCNPSELKVTRNGERRPNSRETWMDVQARALHQAFRKIYQAYTQVK